MRFLHLIQLNEKNLYNTLKQLQEIETKDEHIFYVCNYKRMIAAFPKFREFNNFLYVNEKASDFGKMLDLFKQMWKADHIIFNSLIFNSNKYLYFIFLFQFFLKKSTWIEWGADLYKWKVEGNNLKIKILNYINFTIRKKMKYIGITFEGDEIVVHDTIRKDVKCFFTPLVFGDNRIAIIEKNKKIKKDSYINIQIAHNSYPFNKHIECLKKFKKFNKEKIRIFLPFSYGNYTIYGVAGGKTYQSKVMEYAYKYFDKRNITVMTKFMDLTEYLKHLWCIDIAIFASERPIGLANIFYLLYMKKKVYLPKSSPQYIFLKNKNLNVYPIEEISNLSFNEFLLVDEEKDNNYVKARLENRKDIKYWEYFFNYVSEVYKK